MSICKHLRSIFIPSLMDVLYLFETKNSVFTKFCLYSLLKCIFNQNVFQSPKSPSRTTTTTNWQAPVCFLVSQNKTSQFTVNLQRTWHLKKCKHLLRLGWMGPWAAWSDDNPSHSSGLEINEFYVPLQPKPFCDPMKSTMYKLNLRWLGSSYSSGLIFYTYSTYVNHVNGNILWMRMHDCTLPLLF